MSEKTTSQTQHKKATTTFPVEGMFGLDAWRKLADENVARVTQWWEEVAKFERTGIEQASRAIDESAKLAHESLQYAAQVAGEWRKMTMDVAKRTLDLTQHHG